jgi:hypothetical protein
MSFDKILESADDRCLNEQESDPSEREEVIVGAHRRATRRRRSSVRKAPKQARRHGSTCRDGVGRLPATNTPPDPVL